MPTYLAVGIALTVFWLLAEWHPAWPRRGHLVLEDQSLRSLQARALRAAQQQDFEVDRPIHVVGFTQLRFRVVLRKRTSRSDSFVETSNSYG